MPTKIFTTITDNCPFGVGPVIDSPGCRKCPYYYRAGTATFFWCNHPPAKVVASVLKKPRSVLKTTESVPKVKGTVPKTAKTGTGQAKRGRPAGKGKIKPAQAHETKKR